MISKVLSFVELDLRARTPRSEFLGLMRELWPKSIGNELTRIGGNQDGAYLLPRIISGDEICISPGVGNSVNFEIDLFDKFGVPSVLLDHSVEKPKSLPESFVFIQKSLGSADDDHSVSLNTLVSTFAQNRECIVQMDIESAEYLVLSSLDPKTKNQIKLFIIEFHNIHYWSTRIYFENIVKPAFESLLKDFFVVHAKPNNADSTFSFAGYSFPNTLEITLISRRIAKPKNLVEELPHPLDVKNNPQNKFLDFPKIQGLN